MSTKPAISTTRLLMPDAPLGRTDDRDDDDEFQEDPFDDDDELGIDEEDNEEDDDHDDDDGDDVGDVGDVGSVGAGGVDASQLHDGESVVDPDLSAGGLLPRRKPRTKKDYPPSETMYIQLLKNLCDLREMSRKAINLARETQKCASRETRDLRNQLKKQKGERPKRKPRGFAMPSLISHEMIQYLLEVTETKEVDRKLDGKVVGKITIEDGCSLARNELVSALCRHFEKSGMRKNPADHRQIFLDNVTAKLLHIDNPEFLIGGGLVSDAGEPIITYFDLSKHLGQHCGKKAIGH